MYVCICMEYINHGSVSGYRGMLSRQLACAHKSEMDYGTTYLSISHRMYVCVCVYQLAVSFICCMYS